MAYLSLLRGFFPLFKFYRSRRFAGQIVEYTIDSFHLIDDPAHDFLQDFKRDFGTFGSHEVDGLDGAERYGVIVGSLVTHDSHRAHVGEGRKVLVDFFVEAGVGDFFAVDGVGVLNDADFLSGDFANDADAKTRAREWLAEYQIFRDASSRPALRTSSLKRSRRGSMISLKSTYSGRPPTLW